jgi:prevent-host-death family protein
MPRLENIKPISYFKANAAEMLKVLRETGQPYVLTQNGEAAAVLMDAREYDKLQQALVMLQLIRMSEKQLEEGRFSSIEDVKARFEERHAKRKS